VAPQLAWRGDHWHRHADDVADVVRGVQRAHGGDPARTYLTGFSFGGNGVFDLGAARPDLWAALWAVDPTRVPRQPLRQPVWLSVGEVARRATAIFRQVLDLEAPAGDAPGDRVVLDEGEDHVGSATSAYRDERVYQWLLARRLPEAR
jgi:poly(3-hydroxybutyrate) depolymerase